MAKKNKDPFPGTTRCGECNLPFFWHELQAGGIDFCLSAIMNDKNIDGHKEWLKAHPGALRLAWQRIDARYHHKYTCPTCGHEWGGYYDRLTYKPSEIPEPAIIKALEKEGC